MFCRNNTTKLPVFICALSVTAIVLISSAMAHEEGTPDMDIRQAVLNSGFIFKGQVEKIEYRNSEALAVIDPTTGLQATEEGIPVFEDGSDLPHTFVTFNIERIYKGKAPVSPTGGPLSQVTLRFVGGPYPYDSEEILFVDTHPLFDIGDRSILFVDRNEMKECPLYHNGYGRLWLLGNPEQGERNFVYNNYGQELVLVPATASTTTARDEVAFGPFHEFPEILINTIGDFVLEKVVVDPEDEYALPGIEPDPQAPIVKGAHFEESKFDTFLDDIVAEVHSQRELDALPPVNNADASLSFTIEPFTEDEPNDFDPEPTTEEPREWLDSIDPERRDAILEAERVEAQLLELTGGDPVLPETSCDLRIATEGPIDGDISGPDGRPDCHVDFFDFSVLALNWLECNDPDDPLCFEPL